jgi:hypothetical protein
LIDGCSGSILCKGFGDFVVHFKPRLTDSMKVIQKQAFSILVKLSTALGSQWTQEFKPYAKQLVTVLASNLGEKHLPTKIETKNALKSLMDTHGTQSIIAILLSMLLDNNADLRLETLSFLGENFTCDD